MSGDYLVIIQNKNVLKYRWSAPLLTGKRDVSLVEYISLHKSVENKDSNLVIDAAYRDQDVYYLFADNKMIELSFNSSGSTVQYKETRNEFFHNCEATADKLSKKSTKDQGEQLRSLESVYDSLKDPNQILGRLVDDNSTETIPPDVESNSTTPRNSSFNLAIGYPIQLLCLLIVFVNIFKRI